MLEREERGCWIGLDWMCALFCRNVNPCASAQRASCNFYVYKITSDVGSLEFDSSFRKMGCKIGYINNTVCIYIIDLRLLNVY